MTRPITNDTPDTNQSPIRNTNSDVSRNVKNHLDGNTHFNLQAYNDRAE